MVNGIIKAAVTTLLPMGLGKVTTLVTEQANALAPTDPEAAITVKTLGVNVVDRIPGIISGFLEIFDGNKDGKVNWDDFKGMIQSNKDWIINLVIAVLTYLFANKKPELKAA